MGADIFNISISGLMAFRTAISTTGHNIQNANSESYSRQSVELSARTPNGAGSVFVGNGVKIDEITRFYDKFVTEELRDVTSSQLRLESYYSEASQLDSTLADPNISVANGIEDFFNAFQNAINTPSDLTSREVLLSQSSRLVDQFTSLESKLQNQLDFTNDQIKATTTEINAITNNIAALNTSMQGTSNPSPDLLDQRDQLLKDLSELIKVDVTEQPNNTISVSIGSGLAIVDRGTALQLNAEADHSDSDVLSIFIKSNNVSIDVSNLLSNGKLKGLLDFSNQTLMPAFNGLGRIALAMSSDLNTQHKLGMDLEGKLGTDLFGDLNATALTQSRVISNSNNAGNAVITTSITDTNSLTDDDYEVFFSNTTDYSLINLSTGSAVTSGSLGGLPDTISADGFTITVASGTLSAGDSFKIIPTRNAGNEITLNLSNPKQFALATPIRSSSDTNNAGTGSISAGIVSDTTNSAFTSASGTLSPPVNIVFTSATQYQVVNATTSAVIDTVTYVPNTENAVFPTGVTAYDPGYRFTITGAPATGDTFRINYNTNGYNDNRNGLLLSDLQSSKKIGGSTESYQQSYANLIGRVASKTHELDLNKEANKILVEKTQERRDGISGVNLDEEAADLLRLEQAYQAATQLISVANTMFSTLLNAVGG